MSTTAVESDGKRLLLDYVMPSQVRMVESLAEIVEGAIGDRPDLAFSTTICLEELITNTIAHGLGNAPDHSIRVRILRSHEGLEISIKDDAPAFDPFHEAPLPDLDGDIENRTVGGLGLHIVRTLMDEAWASYDGTGNLITLKKNFR
jgi:serine/threonine-protein kinase RsbW/sigma-B regulation protein RsbU (phosphoserine phosphatase)